MSGLDATDRCSSCVPGRFTAGRPATLALLAAVVMGCSSAAEGEIGSGGEGGSFDPSGDGPWSSAGEADDDDDAGAGESGSQDGSTGGDPTGPAGDTGGGKPLPPPGDDDGTFATCPEGLPSGWVFCQDFETIADPHEVVLDYQDGSGQDGGSFLLVDGMGASGSHSMEVSYQPGFDGAGSMVVSFGASPIAFDGRPSYAPDASFEEVYWRLRVKMEPGWPSIGPGQLTRTVSFASDDWSEAAVAHLRSAGADVTMEALPVTCVSGMRVDCAGYDDEASLKELGSLVGETPIFSEEMSGQWHCVEGHMVLNAPGLADGTLEFWIDEELQASRSDLDLRGSWTEYAINALVIENLWPGGAPVPLRRWIDDVVISTEPIGCGPPAPPETPGV
jgi:hypothetical protein